MVKKSKEEKIKSGIFATKGMKYTRTGFESWGRLKRGVPLARESGFDREESHKEQRESNDLDQNC